MNHQQRLHALRKLEKIGITLRASKNSTHTGQAMLYQFPTVEELRAANAQALAQSEKRGNSQSARKAREKVSKVIATHASEAPSHYPRETGEGINNDTQKVSILIGEGIKSDILEGVKSDTPINKEIHTYITKHKAYQSGTPNGAQTREQENAQPVALFDGMTLAIEWNSTKQHWQPVQTDAYEYWTEAGAPPLMPCN